MEKLENNSNYPIILFVYNRLDHTKKVIKALSKNKEFNQSPFYIFSDNSKESKDIEAVNQVRNYIEIIGHPHKEIIHRKENFGINRNFMEGITQVLKIYLAVIIIDDDTIVSPFFLKFMNDGLDKYKDEKKIGAICGYAPNFLRKHSEDTFFMYKGASWGWAVWERSWRDFTYQYKVYWDQIVKKNKQDLITYNGNLFWVKDKLSVIDIQFSMYMILNDMLVLSPTRSLVNTIGSDGTGVNTPKSNNHKTKLLLEPIALEDIDIIDNTNIRNKFNYYYKKKYIKHKIIVAIKRFFRISKKKE